MASYQEIVDIARNSSTLANKVEAAVAIRLKQLMADTGLSTAKRQWAKSWLSDGEIQDIVLPIRILVLEAMSSLTVAAIEAVTESAVQTEVNTLLDLMFDVDQLV